MQRRDNDFDVIVLEIKADGWMKISVRFCPNY